MSTPETPDGWSEDDSTTYRQLAAVAVPRREEQMAALLALLPFPRQRPFRAVELGCGEGLLGAALLTAFPQATLRALDGSASMRETARRRLSRFGDRATVTAFDLTRDDWLDELEPVDAVVSSLCVHHLDDEGKGRLFQALYDRLRPGGALLILDLVAPRRPETERLWAELWDRQTAHRARDAGDPRLFERFVEERWNLYRHPDPEVDHPTPLHRQLDDLRRAGFVGVDCFDLHAGHALYGGYRAGGDPGEADLSWQNALEASKHRSSSNGA